MSDPTAQSTSAPSSFGTEAETARDPDAIAGLAMVRARVALCTETEQAAFWEAVRRCFGGPPPETTARAG